MYSMYSLVGKVIVREGYDREFDSQDVVKKVL